MSKQTSSPSIVHFLRKRDYVFVKTLGRGGCGETVLLHDDIINDDFVCKKYSPLYEDHKEELFGNFIREIRLLHQIHHRNVVRAFNYYLYPDNFTGYILMEYISGTDIASHLSCNQESANDIFRQTIEGFAYLESINVLHRDIRPQNIMVSHEGAVKIIDLGFGKRVEHIQDFDKSISLNWWCEPPLDFQRQTYDFTTEVYFVGKLFEAIIQENGLEQFKYGDILRRMCQLDPIQRVPSFLDALRGITAVPSDDIEFSPQEIEAYRNFAEEASMRITQIESGTKYTAEIEKIKHKLEVVYKSCMLEEEIPDSAIVLRCLMEGNWYYRKGGFQVAVLRNFLKFLRGANIEKQKIALANLHTRLDAIKRYTKPDLKLDDDIPF